MVLAAQLEFGNTHALFENMEQAIMNVEMNGSSFADAFLLISALTKAFMPFWNLCYKKRRTFEQARP
jgi:hypothetical protein